MADNTTLNEDRNKAIDQANDTEPATGHDVGIGGGIGVVGGAIVGGLAGGPVGAVIGAVAGGVVSAGAVDAVDKHDHDYLQTVNADENNAAAPATDTVVETPRYQGDYIQSADSDDVVVNDEAYDDELDDEDADSDRLLPDGRTASRLP